MSTQDKNAYINHITYFLPKAILTNEDIHLQHPEWDALKIAKKTGIHQRHIAGENEFASDLAKNACERLFNETKIERESIDFIIYCTQSPDYLLPTTACILQNELNLSTSCGAIDFNLGCSGYIYGLALAKSLIVSSIAKNVILITAETYSKYINENDKSNKTIFGDAATASLITSKTKGYKIKEFSLGTDGSGSENLIVKNGGIRYGNVVGEDIYDVDGEYDHNDNNLFMNGGAIFSFTSKIVPKLVQDILEKNGKVTNEIDFFVFHQANKYMLDFLRKRAKIPADKFIYALEKTGNTVSNTIPIALSQKGDILKGNILLAGFGVGLSWGGTVIEKV